MKNVAIVFFVLLFIFITCFVSTSEELDKVSRATEVIEAMMESPDKTIPEYMFKDAYGYAVIPDVLKIGLFIGGRRGEGIMSVRRPDGSWGNPFFITLYGGSIGWQMGVQRVDIVLVFKSEESIEAVMNEKFTLGADAAIAIGPVGRQAEATTDFELKAEIYSYALTKGFFAGLTIEGSVLQINEEANAAFYGIEGIELTDIVEGSIEGVPSEVESFKAAIERYL